MGYRICPCVRILKAVIDMIELPFKTILSFYTTCSSMGKIQDVLSL